MLETLDDLKKQLRTFGAATYTVSDGTVTVTEAGEKRMTGTRQVLNVERFLGLSAAEQAKLVKLGIVEVEPVFTRATTAQVRIAPAAAVLSAVA